MMAAPWHDMNNSRVLLEPQRAVPRRRLRARLLAYKPSEEPPVAAALDACASVLGRSRAWAAVARAAKV